VVPKESAHFGFYNGSRLLALREQPMYTEDWLGLRALDEGGRLLLLHAPGPHMQFSLAWFTQEVLLPFLAVPLPAAAADTARRGPGAAGVAAGAAALSRKLR
jgi:palmitoyl-protein thioesterase